MRKTVLMTVGLAAVETGARAPGTAFRLYLVLYGTLRILLDPLRADGRPERLLGVSIQQAIALAVIVLAIAWPRAALRRRVGRSVPRPT